MSIDLNKIIITRYIHASVRASERARVCTTVTSIEINEESFETGKLYVGGSNARAVNVAAYTHACARFVVLCRESLSERRKNTLMYLYAF